MKKTKYEFKKGQKISLDEIYVIQGLDGGDWWEQDDVMKTGGEDVTILRDITIEIIVR